MDAVRIRRLSARYHLPPSREVERERLGRILHAVLDEALERALGRAGVSPHEEICIRNLHAPVRLRLSQADSTLVLAWSLALSGAIVRARNDQPGPKNVVRYNSPAHALFDVAAGVATDRFDRVWAWRLARVWRGSDVPTPSEAAAELVFALLQQPTLIAPLFAALAARDVPAAVFAGLGRRISAQQWLALARAALHAAGVSASIIDDTVTPGIAEVVRQAHRMLAACALADALVAVPHILMEALEMRRAFAALIALEQDPAALRPSARARVLVSALADAMHPATFRALGASQRHSPSLQRELQPLLNKEREPQPLLNEDLPAVVTRRGLGATQRHSPSLQQELQPLLNKEREPQPVLNEDLPAVVTRRASTKFGGLLFLLKLIEELDLPEQILVSCRRRPFRWALHQLALALVPAEPDDPAALACAGLPPDATPPSGGEEPPDDAEGALIASFVERVLVALETRLEEKRPIAFVCYRAAEIVADPGWIEVHLSLNDVSTSIRRAGLDLDPGYLPWLGVVVSFVYE
jgi:hypothetical protein